jgi:hypothetical protein
MTDDDLLQAFEARTLPFEQWTHRAHVKVAFTYLRRHPFDVAMEKMRTGVKAYNAIQNVPEGPTSGYNETTTHAFMHLISATFHAYGETFPTPTADGFCDTHPQLMTRHALRLFYSPGRRMHPLAKTQFIEPDLSPLPKIAPGESLAPEPYLGACLEVIRFAILNARSAAWRNDVSADQLADLMDAVHNLPTLINNWGSCNQLRLREMLEGYDTKWANSGTKLLSIYDGVIAKRP